jgi:hypothetical protein
VYDVEPRVLTGDATISFSCAGGCLANFSSAVLATDCSNASGFLQLSSNTSVRVSTTDLQRGDHYLFCIDIDGNFTTFAPGSSGLKVYYSGITGLEPLATPQLPAVELRIGCSGGSCSNESVVFLARSCTDPRTQGYEAHDIWHVPSEGSENNTAPARLQADGDGWVAVVDTTETRPGEQYSLCADLDGDGPQTVGDTGYTVYLSAISSILEPTVVVRENQTVRVVCESCTNTSTGYLAMSCENGGSRTAVSAFQGSGPIWSLRFDAGHLVAGAHYRMCMDLDGDLPQQEAGDTEMFVYTTPLFLDKPATIFPLEKQAFTVNCIRNCTDEVLAYLAKECVHEPNATNRTVLVPQVLDDQVLFRVNVTQLLSGEYYNLCVDLDGNDGPLLTGNTMVEVYISGVTEASGTIMVGRYEGLTLTCISGCSEQSVGALALECPSRLRVGEKSSDDSTTAVRFTEGDGWVLQLDTSDLRPGHHYRVCTDLDGVGPQEAGDTTVFVYLSGVFAIVFPTVRAEVGEIALRCRGGCSTSSIGYLATACDESALAPSQRTAPATFKESDGQFVLPVNATNLTGGAHFFLCTDLDGDGMQAIGDTTLDVYVSVLFTVDAPLVFYPKFEQKFHVSCLHSCTSYLTAYMARSCTDDVATLKNMTCGNANVSNCSYAPLATTVSNDTVVFAVNATHLRAGEYYRVCTDVDGGNETLRVGDSAVDVYLSAAITTDPVLLRLPGQHHEVFCSSRCNFLSYAALALDCTPFLDPLDVESYWEPISSDTFLHSNDTAKAWTFQIDARAFTAGVHYKLCVDHDGVNGSSPVGPTNLSVYVSGVTSLQTETILLLPEQRIVGPRTYAAAMKTENPVGPMRIVPFPSRSVHNV